MTRTKKQAFVIKIDRTYKNYLKKIIKSKLYTNINIPLEWEDIYQSFLMEILNDDNLVNREVDQFFKTYLGTRCRWFTQNILKKYNTNRHRLLNVATTIVDDNVSLNDSQSIYEEMEIDISDLSPRELKVYKYIYLENKTMKETSKIMNRSLFKLRRDIESIKSKVRRKLKN